MTTPQPRLFVSATTADLGSCRQAIKEALLTQGCLPVEQTNFPPAASTVREMLREKIRSCSAVIHLAGQVYGAEPQQCDEDEHRRSYTQLEYDIARELGKPVYVFVCGDGFPYDEHEPEDSDKQARQAEHRQALQAGDELYTSVASPDELVLKVGQLEERIQALTDQLQREQAAHEASQRHVGRWAAVITLLLIAIAGGIWLATQHQAEDEQATRKQITDSQEEVQETIQEALVVDKARIREHLTEASESAYQRDLAKVEMLTDWETREVARQSAEEAKQRREDQIDILADEFAQIEAGGKADAVLTEMTRIIQEQGVEQALRFIDSKRKKLLTDYTTSQTEGRISKLDPLFAAAQSAEASGKVDQAESLLRDILDADPAWVEPRQQLANILINVKGPRADSYGTHAERSAIYKEARDQAQRLSLDDQQNREFKQLLAMSNTRYANSALKEGKRDEAMRAYQDALQIYETFASVDEASIEAIRMLARAQVHLAEAMADGGDRLDAIQMYLLAIATLERASTIKEDDAESIELLLSTVTSMAVLAVQDSNFAEIILVMQPVMSVMERFENVDDLTPEMLVIGIDFFFAMGDFVINMLGESAIVEFYEEIMSELEQEIEKLEASSEDFPWDEQRSKINSHFGQAYLDADEFEKALASYRLALQQRLSLQANDPENLYWQRDVAVSHGDIASVYVAQAKYEAAQAELKRSYNIIKHMADQDPRNTMLKRELAKNNDRLGDILVATGDPALAEEAYTKAMAYRIDLVRVDPHHMQSRLDLAASYERAGARSREARQFESALVSQNAAIDAYRHLMRTDPGNSQWRVKIADGHSVAGDIQFESGDIDSAIANHQSAIDYFEKLVSQNDEKMMPYWHHGLAREQTKIGYILESSDESEKALAAFDLAYETHLSIIQEGLGSEEARVESLLTIIAIADIQEKHSQTDKAEATRAAAAEAFEKLPYGVRASVMGEAIKKRIEQPTPDNAN